MPEKPILRWSRQQIRKDSTSSEEGSEEDTKEGCPRPRQRSKEYPLSTLLIIALVSATSEPRWLAGDCGARSAMLASLVVLLSWG